MEEWLHPLLRAAHYGLLLGLFGLTAFPLIGLRNFDRPRASALVLTAALIAPCISIALMLFGIAAMMGQSVTMLEGATVKALLSSTTIGWAFALRLVLLVSAGIMLRKWPMVAAILYALALLTLPYSGHAAAGEGLSGLLHRLNDGVHLLAAGLWFGAIGWFFCLVRDADKNRAAATALLSAMHRFAPLGIALVATVTLTGAVNAHLIFGLGNSIATLRTEYGQLLVLKIALVAFMLVYASRHAAMARHAVLKDTASQDDHIKTLAAARKSLFGELALALAVIGAVAALGLLSPMTE